MRYDLTITGNDEAAFQTAATAIQHGLKTLVVVTDQCISSWLAATALQNLACELIQKNLTSTAQAKSDSLPRLYQQHVVEELQSFSASLRSRGVDVLNARVEVRAANEISLSFPNVSRPVTVSTGSLVIATGIERASFQSADRSRQQLTASTVLTSSALPRRLRVIGGGDFGAGLAACLQLSNVQTELITRLSRESSVLEVTREAGVKIVNHPGDLTADPSELTPSHEVDCRGRRGLTQDLKLESIGVEADEHGQLWCGQHFETWCRGVYGVGDVVGFSPDSAVPVDEQAECVVQRVLGATAVSSM